MHTEGAHPWTVIYKMSGYGTRTFCEEMSFSILHVQDGLHNMEHETLFRTREIKLFK